ncbi:MAG: hypothetical protein H6639_11025 [Caldilineaceae bacterium]|nr:hypothetical protein [Caldilineaceae bacterium]
MPPPESAEITFANLLHNSPATDSIIGTSDCRKRNAPASVIVSLDVVRMKAISRLSIIFLSTCGAVLDKRVVPEAHQRRGARNFPSAMAFSLRVRSL